MLMMLLLVHRASLLVVQPVVVHFASGFHFLCYKLSTAKWIFTFTVWTHTPCWLHTDQTHTDLIGKFIDLINTFNLCACDVWGRVNSRHYQRTTHYVDFSALSHRAQRSVMTATCLWRTHTNTSSSITHLKRSLSHSDARAHLPPLSHSKCTGDMNSLCREQGHCWRKHGGGGLFRELKKKKPPMKLIPPMSHVYLLTSTSLNLR